MLRRLRIDPFLVLLVVTVGIAVVLPARGAAAAVVDVATTVAIGLLFFLYGARLSTGEVVGGLRHWRLHTTVLVATFVLFPLLGLAAGLLPAWLLPAPLAAGVLFLCCLPSTVQSSIAFTSLAGGNVPAAVVAASVSNVLGVVLAVTALGARLLRFDEPDRTTILFCGSKKSLAGGLPMAGVLFAGHTVALVVLPVMLFHQLQLMVCATIAGRLARRRAARGAAPLAAS